MKTLVIAGAGGFGKEAAWLVDDVNAASNSGPVWNIMGYVDDDDRKWGSDLYGYKILGKPEQIAEAHPGAEVWYHCTLGIGSQREAMAKRLDALGWHAATLIHPSVICARDAKIGAGVYIAAFSVISCNTTIGNHVVVNHRVAIGHDACVDDFATICAGAQVNGACKIGRMAFIGSNASVVQCRAVGPNAVVAANSLAVQSVPPGVSVLGVPARKIGTFGGVSLGDERRKHE